MSLLPVYCKMSDDFTLAGEGNGKPLVFWPGESHGQKSLVSYCPKGLEESERTEVT